MQKITPFLWFSDRAEDAARFYASIFGNSQIGAITRYGSGGADVSGRRGPSRRSEIDSQFSNTRT